MARSPLLIDTPVGRLYVMDLGFGSAMLMIEADGQAMNYPLGADEARQVARYLTGSTGPVKSSGRVARTPVTDDEIKTAAELYQSDEAGAAGNRQRYVAEQMGITFAQANGRLTTARKVGLLTARYEPGGTGRRIN